MRFRRVVIAAVVLVLVAAAGLAAYQIGTEARAEAAQDTVTRTDSLAVEPDIRQTLVSDTDHDPTSYGANGTETVEYNGTVWESDGNYTYYPAEGKIEFQRDEPGEANVTYQYQVPADQTADDQLRVLTEGYGLLALVGVGLALVVLVLWFGGFAARRLGVIGGRDTRGR